MPSFSANVLKVIDKEVLSHTSGTSSTTTTTSNTGFFSNQTTATATNTIRTDHIQNITFEEEESQDIKRCKFVNQEFETPVGKNTAVFFMNDEAVAYIPSKKAPCKSLNYLSGKDEASVATCVILFLIMCVPFIGTLIYLGNLRKIYNYYKDGSIHQFNKIPLFSVIGVCFVGVAFVSLVTFFVLGIPVAACFAYFSYVGDKLCDEGKKELFNRAYNELEALREKI